MKGLIKLALLIGIVAFALWDYRVLNSVGFSQFEIPEDKSIVEYFQEIGNIKKIEYYKNVFPVDYKWCLYIETKENAYLLNVDDDTIEALNTCGFFVDKLKPQKITPVVPLYVEAVLGGFILCSFFFPNRKRDD